MSDNFAMLSPMKCEATRMMWELAKRESLPLPRTAHDIMDSLDGNMPLYYWLAENGDEVRFTIDHYSMQATLEHFDRNLRLKSQYSFRLKLDLKEMVEA